MSFMYRMVQKYLIIVPFFALFVVFGCESTDTSQNNKNTQVVYTIGDTYTLTFDDLNAYAQNLLVPVRYDDMLEGYTDVKNEMVRNQFKRFDFFDRGLHEKEEVLLPMQRHINEELINAYFNQEYLEEYLTEDFARKVYEEMKYEVGYRQIVLRDKEQSEGEVRSTLQDKADEIVSKIGRGEDFGRLVRTYSQHEATIRTDGYAEPASWKRSVMFPVDSVVFTLEPGDVEVVTHNNAFYIVKVTHRNRVSLDPFEEIEEQVKNQIREAYIEKSLEEYDRFLEQLVSEENLQWNQEAIEKIIEWSRQQGFFGRALYRDTFSKELEKGNNFEIVSYNDEIIDLEKFLFLLDYILIPSDSYDIPENNLKEYFVTALREMKVGELAKEEGLLEEIFHPATKNWVIRNEILIAYNNHVVENMIPEPTEERLRAFYEGVKDSVFYQLRTVFTHIITADTEDEILRLKAEYEAGTPFNVLAHRIQRRTITRDRDGKVYVRNHRTPQPHLEPLAIDLEANDIIGPVEFNDPQKGWAPALVLAQRVLPEKQLSFDEVSEIIEREFKSHHRAIINDKLISEIRSRYDHHFYEEHLVNQLKDRGML
ncbi:peptidyl-prolyl cis-trans isomerase [Balneolaceae bacterium ANBcel3]|nr:peptidyl-prolyl cis-trans isomerase [Balneolaceae bacterium ANBcel3]